MKHFICLTTVFVVTMTLLPLFAYGENSQDQKDAAVEQDQSPASDSAGKDAETKEINLKETNVLYIKYLNPDNETHHWGRLLTEYKSKIDAHRNNPELIQKIEDQVVMEHFSIMTTYEDQHIKTSCGVKPAARDINAAKELADQCEAYLATPIPDSDRKPGERIVLAVEYGLYPFRWCPPGEFTMGSPETEEG